LTGIDDVGMEVLRLGPDVEPLPHEGLGPGKLHTRKERRAGSRKWEGRQVDGRTQRPVC
jgi:hypothetical protein